MRERGKDPATERPYYLHLPDELSDDDEYLVIVSLHGGGSSGLWQDLYFPVHDVESRLRLVVITPWLSKWQLTTGPVPDGEDQHLFDIVESVVERLGPSQVAALWLAGHSRGGFLCYRLLQHAFFAERVDGWLSLSGGRLGYPDTIDEEPRPLPQRRELPLIPGDFSFVFAVGSEEIDELPLLSSIAERHGAGPRYLAAEIIDEGTTPPVAAADQTERLHASPGTAQLLRYPTDDGAPIIADIVRIGKGHTDPIEPNVLAAMVELMEGAPGGNLRRLHERTGTHSRSSD